MEQTIAFELTNGEKKQLKIVESQEKRAIVLIIHGMAEHMSVTHALRNALKKQALLPQGLIWQATAKNAQGALGRVRRKNGWDNILKDVANARALLIKNTLVFRL